jgi:hypothetical protein
MDEQIRIVTLCHIAIFGICKVMQQQNYGKLREIQCPQGANGEKETGHYFDEESEGDEETRSSDSGKQNV